MTTTGEVDYYEVLQVSDTAEPETINRVYRIFAQRYHPDNQETGNEARFREITEAYHILSNPEKRAQYDATSQKRRKARRQRTTSNSSKPYVSLCSSVYTRSGVSNRRLRVSSCVNSSA